MISFVFPFPFSVWMNQGRKGSSIDDEPRYKCSKLRRCEQIHLEHCHRMRSHRPIPKLVYPELWKLLSDAVPQCFRKGRLILVGLEVVYMYVEATAAAIGDAMSEVVVTLAEHSSLDVFDGFPILIQFAEVVSSCLAMSDYTLYLLW